MVIIKPKLNTVFSIGIFILANFALSVFMAWKYFNAKNPAFYQSAIMVFTGALGISLFIKFLWNWKTIEAGKGKFIVSFPFRFRRIILSGKEMKHWAEEIVKTWGGNYAELTINFENKKQITMSKQEHDGYGQMIAYLTKNFKKLQR